MTPRRILILTDGKAGDEGPCLALAGALGGTVHPVQLAPRVPWVTLMPWGPPDPRDWRQLDLTARATARGIDMVVATGRRAVPYLRRLKAELPSLFTVFLKDPRVPANIADVIWVPAHDALRGPHVVTTVTGPHRFRPEALKAQRAGIEKDYAHLNASKVAVLVGGNSRHMRFTPRCQDRLIAALRCLAGDKHSLLITTSRRTPTDLVCKLEEDFAGARDHILWSGSGRNPLFDFLALADGVVVSADSANMMGEATATGKPVMVFRPKGASKKLDQQYQSLAQLGAVHEFTGRLAGSCYEPIDAMPQIVDFICQAYMVKAGSRVDSSDR